MKKIPIIPIPIIIIPKYQYLLRSRTKNTVLGGGSGGVEWGTRRAPPYPEPGSEARLSWQDMAFWQNAENLWRVQFFPGRHRNSWQQLEEAVGQDWGGSSNLNLRISDWRLFLDTAALQQGHRLSSWPVRHCRWKINKLHSSPIQNTFEDCTLHYVDAY